MKKHSLAFFSIFIFCLTAVSAYADKLDDLHAQIEVKKEKHTALLTQERKLNKEVKNLNQTLVKTANDLQKIESTLSAADKKIKSLQEEHTNLSGKMFSDYDSIGSLIIASQRFKGASVSELLLKQTPKESAQAALVMRSLLPELDKRSAALRARVTELENVEQKISEQKIQKSKELIKFNKKEDDLERLLKERSSLYEKTSADRKAQELEMAKLAKDAKNIEDLISRIKPEPQTSGSHFKMPSNVLLPVRGNIIIGFGEKDALGAVSKGLTFQAASRAAVVTPMPGKVKFAGPFQKYKQILIIDHGGGYHSLIAGLGRINTVVGATVNAGEPVGQADDNNDAALYYELRQNGSPVNPQKLSTAQQRKQK